MTPNQLMKPTPNSEILREQGALASRLTLLRNKFRVFAMTPGRGLPQLHLQNSWVQAFPSR